MKRRYDVPQGRKVWVVEEQTPSDYSFQYVAADGNMWIYTCSPYIRKIPFTSYHRAMAYVVKQRLLTQNKLEVMEVLQQDFRMWRKR